MSGAVVMGGTALSDQQHYSGFVIQTLIPRLAIPPDVVLATRWWVTSFSQIKVIAATE
ncbi:Hypothetical predicted protein [Olea europaea subsp. europaea]|uniref:Uncharacterized protein n=1 Tax=Olea europaea subsp. europaea TaxID=158383 RepID=A0A8S0RJL3_OLEEU|nr:Hypothetical predicted protein [Olea europaea subsp. europaea]